MFESDLSLTVVNHALLDLQAFVTEFPGGLGERPTSSGLARLLKPGANAPFSSSDEIRRAIRDLLRLSGFKPTGRSKPASEYLLRAVEAGQLSPINPAVDACNAVSLHSGLPISVVDVALTQPPLGVAVAEPGSQYIFNRSGQSIDVGGLLCLMDALGPCANAVKDAQRTKTHDQTTTTLSLVWGSRALPGRAAEVAAWYRELLEAEGATCRVTRYQVVEHDREA